MASYIRRMAQGLLSPDEWETVMVNHYSDIETENARRRVVKAVIEGNPGSVELSEKLHKIGDLLDLPIDERTFYFKNGAAGLLLDPIGRFGELDIDYEPMRSASHYELCLAISAGEHPQCEYMEGSHRKNFTVLKALGYGKLTVRA